MSITRNVLAIVLLLGGHASFALMEFAPFKAKGCRLSALTTEGGSAAGLVSRFQNDLEASLAPGRLAITMVSLGLGWVGEGAVVALPEPLHARAGLSEAPLDAGSLLVGLVVSSSLHVVVGEQRPRTITGLPAPGEANRAGSPSREALRQLVPLPAEHGEQTVDRALMMCDVLETDERPIARALILGPEDRSRGEVAGGGRGHRGRGLPASGAVREEARLGVGASSGSPPVRECEGVGGRIEAKAPAVVGEVSPSLDRDWWLGYPLETRWARRASLMEIQ